MDKNIEPTSYEVMQERGKFEANGYIFTIEPVYFGEEEEYWQDVQFLLHPEKDDCTDRDLAKFGIMLFQMGGSKGNNVKGQLGLFQRMILWLVKHTTKRYKYYSDNPSMVGAIKWIEKKVKYKGKHIRFYDLERKFGLSKSEIIKMFGYFEAMSGF